ncbi:MAG: hypothetical protein HY270_12735 [Deltaproteobacteria bacterium]|nr:hypothetical protein [Deltaproteobacteria bacterium]
MRKEPALRARGRAWLLVVTLFTCYAYFPARWADWNQNSRFDLTRALVEQRTIRIDAYYLNTGDYSAFGGHVYSDKAPGLSFVAVPAYYAFEAVAGIPLVQSALNRMAANPAFASTLRQDGSGLQNEKVAVAAALCAVTWVVVSLPSVLLALLLYRGLRRTSVATGDASLMVLAYGLATIAFPYSTVFYGHQLAAVLLFAAFQLLSGDRIPSSGRLFIAGVLLGLAVLTEFPALITAALLTAYAAWSLRPKLHTLVWLAAGALPFAITLGCYNAAAFGSPFTSSYRYLATFSNIANTGTLGFTHPRWEAVWGITFSPYRGLFFLSPFLLLAVPGTWRLLRQPATRPATLLSTLIVLAHGLAIVSWYDWRGGYAIGPRNLLPVLPFLMPAVAKGWTLAARHGTLRWLLLAVSFAFVWVAAVSGQDFAPVDFDNPLLQYFWPKLRAGDITRNLGMVMGLHGWWSLMPPLFLSTTAAWFLARHPSGRFAAGETL